MLRRFGLLLALGVVGAATAALAEDIKDKVPPDLLAQYCIGKDFVTENQVSLMLPDGSTISGTLTCAADDLVPAGTGAPNMAAPAGAEAAAPK